MSESGDIYHCNTHGEITEIIRDLHDTPQCPSCNDTADLIKGRVGAFAGYPFAEKREIKIYGFGEVQYVEVSDDGSLFDGEKHPKIILDDGGIVYGMGCWWMDEKRAKKLCELHTIVEVPAPKDDLNW